MKNAKVKLSIIIPVYNTKKLYLKECIESVTNLDNKSPVKYMKYVDHGQCVKLFKKSIIGNIRYNDDIKLSED